MTDFIEILPSCDCMECAVVHLADDLVSEERVTFTAHEVADAWMDGHDRGVETLVRQLIATLTDWLGEDT